MMRVREGVAAIRAGVDINITASLGMPSQSQVDELAAAVARSPWATSVRGLLGGVNALIVGNHLTTLGRPASGDLALLDELRMPVKALSATP